MPQSRKMGAGVLVGADPGGLSLAEPLLDAPEAAELLNVRVSWVRDAARERVLPCLRVGRHLRFTKTMLEDWLAEKFNDCSTIDQGRTAGRAIAGGAPAGSFVRSRSAFRPRTDAALLAALSERPARSTT